MGREKKWNIGDIPMKKSGWMDIPGKSGGTVFGGGNNDMKKMLTGNGKKGKLSSMPGFGGKIPNGNGGSVMRIPKSKKTKYDSSIKNIMFK